MSLLEQNTIRKRRIDENNITKLNANDNKGGKYKVEPIYDSAVYARESASYLPKLYYLVF